MKTKYLELRAIISIVLLFLLFNIAFAACDSKYILGNLGYQLSQGKACGNDTVGIIISNIPECNSDNIRIMYGSGCSYGGDCQTLCSASISNGQYLCYFKAPDEVSDKYIYAVINNGIEDIYTDQSITISGDTETVSTMHLNIVERPKFQQCYDAYGTPIPCNEACTDSPHTRLWENVSAISLPLHFTFGMSATVKTVYSTLLPLLIQNRSLMPALTRWPMPG